MSTATITPIAFAPSAPQRSSVASATSTAPTSHLRITKRGRAVLLALVAIPVVIVAVLLGLNGGGATAGIEGSSRPLESVTVMAGETLWQIAEDVAPSADPRDVVAEITELNQLGAADILPGQKLDIPAKYTAGK